jgi:hypothetical protein
MELFTISPENENKINKDEAKFILDQAEKTLKEIGELSKEIVGRSTTLISVVSGILIAIVAFITNRWETTRQFDSILITAILLAFYLFYICFRLTRHFKAQDYYPLGIDRLARLDGKTLGISVGDAGRLKTETELDAQADLLNQLIKSCDRNQVMLNLHNHTYEVQNSLHDLKGTLTRIPGIKLGPDLNWLVRAGVDPVWFINTYGSQIVYMHIRDQTNDGHWAETVGSGVTDFKAIALALKRQHFNGRAAIELAFDQPPVHPLKEDWKNSLEYVRKTFEWS